MKMPVIFIGHGSPMNAIEETPWSVAMQEFGSRFGKDLPRPKAILCISAHWQTQGTLVSTVENPKTIHDFFGFPQELFDMRYSCPGSPEMAEQTLSTLKPFRALGDISWGLDHGAWSVLVHLFPKADVPVFQVSMNKALNEKGHLEIGKALKNLREQGVLIFASGNIVHTLRMIQWQGNATALPWATTFDAKISAALETRNADDLLFHKTRFGEASKMSVPTDEHYWPLLYAFGASAPEDQLEVLYEGIELGSLSMRSLMWS